MADDRKADAELVRRAAAGEQDACRRLVDAHLGRSVGLAGRMLGDQAEAEDVAQEAFLRLWRQAERWRPDARVGTWLYRVVHNLCVDRLRIRRRTMGEDRMPDLPDPRDGPMQAHHRTQVSGLVQAAIEALPERQRTAITLVHHMETGNIEAAAIMGISVEALESLLGRGRRTLRDKLAALRPDMTGEVQ